MTSSFHFFQVCGSKVTVSVSRVQQCVPNLVKARLKYPEHWLSSLAFCTPNHTDSALCDCVLTQTCGWSQSDAKADIQIWSLHRQLELQGSEPDLFILQCRIWSAVDPLVYKGGVLHHACIAFQVTWLVLANMEDWKLCTKVQVFSMSLPRKSLERQGAVFTPDFL